MPDGASLWRRAGPLVMQSGRWPSFAEEDLDTIEHKLSLGDVEELAATRAMMPAWLTQTVSAMVADNMNQTM